MTKDYSSLGPAYRNFKVREDVYVPEPVGEFSADNPFTKMAPIRGELKDIRFDGTYTYLDKTLKFKIVNTFMYFVAWTLAFLLNHIFPESCSWKFYAPLRPFKIGAFNMAYRHSLPVIPLVISFRPRTGWRKLFSKNEPLITIHVGDSILPNTNTPRKEETARMRDLAHRTMLDMAGIVSNPWPSSVD